MEYEENKQFEEAREFVQKVYEAIKDTMQRLADTLEHELPFLWTCAKNPRLVELANSKKKRTAKKNYNRLMKIAYGRKRGDA